MQRLLRYFDRRQWAMIAASIVFIVIQVWLDLKLPDYMSAITTLVQTEGSAMADILTQGGICCCVPWAAAWRRSSWDILPPKWRRGWL